MMNDLHGLVREVTVPAGAPAWYADASGAPPARAIRSEADVHAVAEALARGESIAVVEAVGETGLEIYRLAASAARVLRERGVRVRVRWSEELGIKAAALALLFGADELVGELAPHELQKKIAIIGGPPEEAARPTRAHVEALIRAAGRTPERMS